MLKNGEEDRELLKSKSMVDPGISTSISITLPMFFPFSLSCEFGLESRDRLKRVSRSCAFKGLFRPVGSRGEGAQREAEIVDRLNHNLLFYFNR